MANKPRKPLPRSTKPLKRSELPRARKPIKARGKPRFKGRVDEAFRKYVRGQPCVLALRHECVGIVQCCHVTPKSLGAPDLWNCYPGCAWAHTEEHTLGQASFQARYRLDLGKIAMALTDIYLAEYGGRYTREHDA